MSAHSSKGRLTSEKETASRSRPPRTLKPLSVTSPRGTLQRAVANPEVARPAEVQALQRSYGNQAVQRLLARHNIQARLTVGPVGDHYEREADNVADQVMKMPAPQATPRPASVQRSIGEDAQAVQTKPLTATITPLVQRAAPEEEEEGVQAKPQEPGAGFEAGRAVEGQLRTLKGGGSPLSTDVRAYMEPRFGADFSAVRVHTDGQAAQLNRQLSAQAFTHGKDIYMPADKYAPDSEGGRRLLAHELTHVIQQGGTNDRIARWGGMGDVTHHKEVTKKGIEEKLDPNIRKWYSPEAQDYLAAHSDDLDMRVGFLIPVKWKIEVQAAYRRHGKGMFTGVKSKTQKNEKGEKELHVTSGALTEKERDKMTASQIEAEEKIRAMKYDDMEGYGRNQSEATNHAEAGLYKRDGTSLNVLRYTMYIEQAIKQWKSKNPRQAMFSLALALHTAQDRGAHNDGVEGGGHDPRRVIPPPNEYAKKGWIFFQSNKGWKKDGDVVTWEGWKTDNKGENKPGWELALTETAQVLTLFALGIGVGGGKETSEEEMRAGAGLANFKKPGLLSRMGRSISHFLGGKEIIKP